MPSDKREYSFITYKINKKYIKLAQNIAQTFAEVAQTGQRRQLEGYTRSMAQDLSLGITKRA